MMSVRATLRRFILLMSLWAAGVAAIYWQTRVGPREGWQPPQREWVCGILRDGHTMATVRWTRRLGPNGGEESEFYGPVRYWDIDTGALVRSQFRAGDLFASVNLYPGLDLLRVARRGSTSAPNSYSVRMYDATSGEELVRLTEAGPAQAHHWEFSADGKIAAAVGVDDQDRKIITIHDFSSGRRLRTFLDCDSIRLSPDGRRVAGRRGSGYVIFDTASAKQIATLGKDPANQWMGPSVQEFSPNGRWARDEWGQIWDIDHDALAFKTRPNSIYSSAFAPDGRTLITVGGTPCDSWLAFYDLPTGQEQTNRRIPLMSFPAGLRNCPVHMLRRDNGSDSLICVEVSSEPIAPATIWAWLLKIPGAERLFQRRSDYANIVVNMNTGRELMRDKVIKRFWALTPDRRFTVRYDYSAQSLELWDVPPRKPFRRLLVAAAIWTACLAVISWLPGRLRRHRGAVMVPAPAVDSAPPA